MKKVSYKWKPIEDLPSRYFENASSELSSLAQIWNEQKGQLIQLDSLKQFNDQLKRKWAIETGIIEQLYTLDRGITQLLIERGIDAAFIPHGATNHPPELVAEIIRDHEAAVETLFDFIKQKRNLSTSYIKELHALLTRHQETSTGIDEKGRFVSVPLICGDWKKQPNNPTRHDESIHEYCPPEHVASEIDRLIDYHLEYLERGVLPEIEAAWFHHRFTQIHPFQDGNGRVVRCLVSLIFLKEDWFPLVVSRENRKEYISALEIADVKNDLQSLINLFSKIQKYQFVGALGVAADVFQKEKETQIIDSAFEVLRSRRDALQRDWRKVKKQAEELMKNVETRFKELQIELQKKMSELSSDYFSRVDSEPDGGQRGHYFHLQIVDTAKKLDYYANTGVFHAWARLILKTEFQSELLISIHGTGREFRGILGCSACFFRREVTEDGERQVQDIIPACDELFQLNYKESPQKSEIRFREWLDNVSLRGIELWRKSL